MASPRSGLSRLAGISLAFTVFVILWGALVRATGSGAGCGSHWPLCNGEVVPQAPAVATIIEFGHRLTSGLALILVVVLWWVARRSLPAEAPARRAALASLIFMIGEALIGAGLVLLEYVADDQRLARGFWVAGHLVNTFLLVAALTACTAWASGWKSLRREASRSFDLLRSASIVGVLLLGVGGAITALGDTLFPAATYAEASAATFSDSAHLFVRLRIWHPTTAVVVGFILLGLAILAVRIAPHARVRKLAAALVVLYGVEMLIGLANVWWLAPVALQLIHLLLADLVWIVLVLIVVSTLAQAESGSAGASA